MLQDEPNSPYQIFHVDVITGFLALTEYRNPSFVDRAPETNLRAAALLSAAGGLTANLALVFHCPKTQPLHLLLVHAPIGLLLLVVSRRLLLRLAPRRAG